jgi:catechol 2,3-dioxygenase-like lactoylglutathione lyase family enzyme
VEENYMKIDPHLKQILGLNEVSQIGIVVKDMGTAIKNYSDIFGIVFPKVFVPEYFNKMYRGKPGDFRVKLALGMMGALQIELIEVLEGKTIYGEFLEKRGEGLHHLGFEVENMDERIEVLEKLGIGVLQSGERIGGRFAYMDTEKIIGVIFEFLKREKKM